MAQYVVALTCGRIVRDRRRNSRPSRKQPRAGERKAPSVRTDGRMNRAWNYVVANSGSGVAAQVFGFGQPAY